MKFTDDCIGEKALEMSSSLKPGEVLMLENVRFHKRETAGTESFAEELAKYGDVYINDAFGTAHRAHASTTIVAKFFPNDKMFGYLIEGEIKAVDKVLNSTEEPLTAIVGGAKVSSKITIIERLLDKVDNLIVGGGMAYTFVKANGGKVGSSLVEDDYLDVARKIMSDAKAKGVNLYIPTDTVIAGDGCLMEGISQEAIGLAGMQELSNLIVLWDNNDITIDGRVSISDKTDQHKRFEASGWTVLACDGHDPEDIDRALTKAKKAKGPVLVDCKTFIGFGSPNKADSYAAHGAPLGDAEIAATKEIYGWPHGPFEIPADVKSAWEAIGSKGAAEHAEWTARFNTLSEAKRAEFERQVTGGVSKKLAGAIRKFKKEQSEAAPKVATRKASEMVLGVINPACPETIGGSADLTGSNLTKTKDLEVFNPDNRKGRYVNYGIREHGMAAAMNGLWLHGGVRPYGGTFFCFTDYARGAMRLSALMGIPAVYVMTHDSIGLGEDGPTHQPVEHLAICRATPNTLTFRPADVVETAEAWEIAMTQARTPSVLALSRQNLPTLRTKHTNQNMVAKGAYVIEEAAGKRQAILMATGSEVEIALKARDLLQAEAIGTRVVSVPCMELFAQQDEAYRRKVLPAGAVRVAVEAAVRQPWDRWLLGERGREGKADFVGMSDFGASAPADRLYAEFGITPEAIAAKVKAML